MSRHLRSLFVPLALLLLALGCSDAATPDGGGEADAATVVKDTGAGDLARDKATPDGPAKPDLAADGGGDKGCTSGARPCYTGKAGTKGVGLCKAGTQTCKGGVWSACVGQVKPVAELCDNLDNDCDGNKDDSLTNPCYTGKAGTKGVGACKGGLQTCAAGKWGACTSQVLPTVETCDNLDNDCDGETDETLSQACYTGTAGTKGVGACKAGTRTCAAGKWSGCLGEVTPFAEVCDGKDNDCDGSKDEQLTQSCYTGKAGTDGVGLCKAGAQTCNSGSWSACSGEVVPAIEICDGKDNDCDGKKDGNLTKPCYTGKAGTKGVGLCKAGTQTCSAGSWGACSGQVIPATETCDKQDNDCNGKKDDLTSCSAQGKNCGTISDGCGGTLSCGSCTSPSVCGGGGVANICGNACGLVPSPTCGAVPPPKGGSCTPGSCATGSKTYSKAGSYTFVVPAGCCSITVDLYGGGGGGACNGCGNAGGGGGAFARKKVKVGPGQTFTVVVGAGGHGSTSGSNLCGYQAKGGSDGGNSTFGGFVAAGGGKLARRKKGQGGYGTAGAGGKACGGDKNHAGGAGAYANGGPGGGGAGPSSDGGAGSKSGSACSKPGAGGAAGGGLAGKGALPTKTGPSNGHFASGGGAGPCYGPGGNGANGAVKINW